MANDEKKKSKGSTRRTLSLPGLEKAERSQSELPLGEGSDSVKNIKTESKKIDIDGEGKSKPKKTTKKRPSSAKKAKPAPKPKPTPKAESAPKSKTASISKDSKVMPEGKVTPEELVSDKDAPQNVELKREEARKAKIEKDRERAT